MYSYKQNAQFPILLVQCECGREFTQEEMYCCLSCGIAQCRFCTSTEIFALYCRNCQEVQQTADTVAFSAINCNNCFECPNCKNVLRRQIDGDRVCSFSCSYCFYSTKIIGGADQQIQLVYQKINSLYKQENEEELKEHQIQFQRIKELEQKILASKKSKQSKLILKNLQSKTEPIIRMHSADITSKQQEKQIKIEFERSNLIINQHKQILLQDVHNMKADKQQIQFPQPLGLLSKKNRKCRKCNKLLIQMDQDKDPKSLSTQKSKSLHWLININSSLYNYAPIIVINQLKYRSKEKKELSVLFNLQNRTKFKLEVQLLSIKSSIMEMYNLLKVKNLPSDKIILNDLTSMTEEESQHHQDTKFEAIIELKEMNKIQFAFKVECKVMMANESKLIYHVNCYIAQ